MPTYRETRSLREEQQEMQQRQNREKLQRSRAKRYKLLRAAVALAVITGIMVIVWTMLGPVRFSNLSDAWKLLGRQGTGFPLEYGYANLQQAALAGKYLALLGPTSLNIYTPAGYEAFVMQQPYAEPALKAVNGRIILFDRDSGKFTLLSKTGVLYKKELERDIFCADLGRAGGVAVGTRAENAASEIYVWDSREKQRFAWRCEKEYPSALRLSGSGNALGLCLLGTRQAGIYARFVEFDFRRKDPRIDQTLEGVCLYGAAEIAGGWLAVGDQAAYLIQRGTKEPQALTYEGRTLSRFDIGGNHCAILLNDWDNRSLLRVYNKQGNLILEQDFAQNPLGLQCASNGSIYLRFSNTLLRWQRITGFRQSQELPQGTQDAFVAGRQAYLITLRNVELMRPHWSSVDDSFF